MTVTRERLRGKQAASARPNWRIAASAANAPYGGFAKQAAKTKRP